MPNLFRQPICLVVARQVADMPSEIRKQVQDDGLSTIIIETPLLILILFVVRIFYVRQCAYMGSKRVIGRWDALFYSIFLGYLGILFILASRKLE